MQVVKLRKVGNSMTVTLPASVVEALHVRQGPVPCKGTGLRNG
ncbi:MAG TPA: hypothetical protein VFA10_21810 [Ktedonobacteraceae bacterium]|nr:hypothetical protein [Ktedonobacteraceae bacterium]